MSHVSYHIIYHRTILYIMSCHIISYHISCHVLYHISPVGNPIAVNEYHIVSYITYHIMSHISYHIIYHHIILYIMSCHIISYRISCHIIAYIISYLISYALLFQIGRARPRIETVQGDFLSRPRPCMSCSAWE